MFLFWIVRRDKTRRECVTRRGNSHSHLHSPLEEDSPLRILDGALSRSVAREILLCPSSTVYIINIACVTRNLCRSSLRVDATTRKNTPMSQTRIVSSGAAYQLSHRFCTERQTEIVLKSRRINPTSRALRTHRRFALSLPYLTRALYHPPSRPTTVATFTIAINGVSRRTTTDKRTASCKLQRLIAPFKNGENAKDTARASIVKIREGANS